jgi:beta-lactamase class A
MAGSERAIAGMAAAVVAAAAVFLVVHSRDGHPSATAGGPSTSATAGHAVAAKPAPHADPLSGAAESYVAGRSGTVLAAVYDVKTGQTWQLGSGSAQDEASVVKLNVLEALLAGHRGGPLSQADQSLAQSMIEDSDNDAATSLWDAAGGAQGVGAYDDKAGLTKTSPSQCVTCAGFPWPGWGLTTTVPGDQLALLKQLVIPGPHPLLSAAQRSYALSLMENVTADQAWGVSGGVPAGVTVALKNGWLPLDNADTDWQVNSVGWVNGDGRDYLIAVLSTGNATEQYGIDTINALSSRIWSALR